MNCLLDFQTATKLSVTLSLNIVETERFSVHLIYQKQTYTTTLGIKPYEIVFKMGLIFRLITHSVLTIL